MELRETAKNMLTSCLAAKPGETLLVITDDSRVKIGTAIYEAGKELGCEAMLLVMKEREVSGQGAAGDRRGGDEGGGYRRMPDGEVAHAYERAHKPPSRLGRASPPCRA